jgi:hypothetical protein
MTGDYSYDDYLEGKDITNPMVAEVPSETFENPVSEYDFPDTDSVAIDEIFSKSAAKDTGLDLNDGGGDVNGVIDRKPIDNNAGIDLNDTGAEQLDAVLDNFHEGNWSDLSLDEQKQSMTELADYVAADTGNENPPEIVFRDDMADGTYGGYNPETNTMEINENMLDNSAEAADTIAHEMWHAYQQQEAADPNSEKGREYQESFDNYISPEYDFEGYENQLVEAEARDYAQGFKDRLAGDV